MGAKNKLATNAAASAPTKKTDLSRLVFDAAGVAVWRIEPGADRVVLSAELGALLKLKAHALDMDAFCLRMAGDDAESLRAAIHAARRGDEGPALNHKPKGRGLSAGRLRTTLRHGEGGAVTGVTQDVSAFFDLREASRARIAQMIGATRSSPNPVALFDLDGRCKAASPAWLRVSGIEGRAYLGRTILEILPGLSPAIAAMHRQAPSADAQVNDEEGYVDSDGRPRWLQTEYRPVMAVNGERVGYMVRGHDVTPMVATRRDAEISAERLRLALNAAQAGVYEVDFRRRSFWCSPEFADVVGRALTFEEASAPCWPMTHPDDVDMVSKKVTRRRRHRGRAADPLDLRIVLPSGETRWRQIQSEWRQDDDGKYTKLVGLIIDIDARKRQELALTETRQDAQRGAMRLALALDAARAGVFETNFAEKTFWSSPEFEAIVGRRLTFEDASRKVWPCLHPDDHNAVADMVTQARLTNSVGAMEARLVLPSGECRWVDFRTIANRNAEGRLVSVIGLILDIDERKRQNLALAEARREAQINAERLHLSLESGRAGVFETDIEHQTFWCSDEFIGLIGRTLTFEEATGYAWPMAHPDDADRVRRMVDEARVERAKNVMESRIIRPDGEIKWIECRTVLHHDDAGALKRITGLLLDIDERKTQELALMEARQEAQIVADRLDFALNAGQAGVFETDFKNGTFWCSQKFVDIMGRALTYGEASQRSWPMTHPDDVESVIATIAAGGDSRGFGMVQSRVILPSGEVRWVDTCAEVYRGQDGAVEKVVGLVLNIDERKKQELTLLEAQRAAEAATEAKSQFLANMSHEIRTPMNGVMGVLHLLERENLSVDGRGLLEEAQGCGQMLAQLLNDVIDLSKIEAGRLELSPEPLNVADTLQSVIRMLRPQAEAKGLKLKMAVSGDEPWILADPVRIRQALFNLIGNAVKFTGEGHVEARLSVADQPDGAKRVRFEIEDTGVGIARDAQTSLFQRFHQADGSTARRFGGSGLGLAITRTLAEMMRGEVGFDSVEGVGSTFWLDVPAPAAQPPAMDAASDDAGALAGMTVLVVEDNPTNRLVAGKILEGLGAAVHTADDGVLGLRAVQDAPYDLVLMDVQMPNMDGVEATRRIRLLGGAVSAVPIIGLTANALAHQRAGYLAAGMNGVAAKPISPPALLAEIARVFNELEDAREEAAAVA